VFDHIVHLGFAIFGRPYQPSATVHAFHVINWFFFDAVLAIHDKFTLSPLVTPLAQLLAGLLFSAAGFGSSPI
jgi:hypothetical protein